MSGRRRAWALLRAQASLPIWSCSVWGLPCLRRYRRSGALLPHHFTLTPALGTGRPGEPFGCPRDALEQLRRADQEVAEAVFFLWHWPSMGFEAHVPDVIRHTALRSSDFPPPANLACAKSPAATARSSCQCPVYRGNDDRTRPALIGQACPELFVSANFGFQPQFGYDAGVAVKLSCVVRHKEAAVGKIAGHKCIHSSRRFTTFSPIEQRIMNSRICRGHDTV